MNLNTVVQQAHDRLDSMSATANYHRGVHFIQPPAQVEVVLQTVKSEYSIKITSGQIERKTIGSAARCNEKRTITKALSTTQTDIFSLGIDTLYPCVDRVNTLGTFGSSGIREQLLLRQFTNGKLLQGRRVDGGMALLANNSNTRAGCETTGFYSGSQSRNTVTHDNDIRTFRFILPIHYGHGSIAHA